MSIRLILMRHAKSDWNAPVGGDFKRPLNSRGRNAAAAIGKWLAANDHFPDLVLCSASTRTRETWDIVASNLGTKPPVEFSRELYLAAPETMFQAVSEVEGANTVLMISHNPGTAILANALAGSAPAHSRFDDYPTAATAVFEFDANEWENIRPGTGQVVDFLVPRDLI